MRRGPWAPTHARASVCVRVRYLVAACASGAPCRGPPWVGAASARPQATRNWTRHTRSGASPRQRGTVPCTNFVNFFCEEWLVTFVTEVSLRLAGPQIWRSAIRLISSRSVRRSQTFSALLPPGRECRSPRGVLDQRPAAICDPSAASRWTLVKRKVSLPVRQCRFLGSNDTILATSR